MYSVVWTNWSLGVGGGRRREGVVTARVLSALVRMFGWCNMGV